MPIYDFPGDFAARFDGVDKAGEWCGYFSSYSNSEGARTLEIRNLKYSAALQSKASGWLSGIPKDLIIERLNRARMPIARYRVSNARLTSLTRRPSQARNEVAIETLEIAHQGFKRIP